MLKHVDELLPELGAFDTETDGLHLTLSKPFLYQFGYIHPKKKMGYTYVVDIERQPILARAVIQAWQKRAMKLKRYAGANVKYDLHMMENFGEPYEGDNLTDTQFYIRYAHDNLKPEKGGPPLGLKPYCARYVDRNARDHEHLLSKEKGEMAQNYNEMLRLRLSHLKPPEKYGAKKYNLGILKKMLGDKLTDIEDLPEDVRTIYLEWLQNDVPIWLRDRISGIVDADDIPYNKLNRENVIKYGHYDIIYTIETVLKTEDVVHNRKNDYGIEMENGLIRPLFEMERCGFEIDVDYLKTARLSLKNYILTKRQRLCTLAGLEIKVSQSKLIKEILEKEFGLSLECTDKDELERAVSDLLDRDPDNPAIEFITIIQDLRTLEKWYATYICRFLKDLKYTTRLYTQINQVGAVSGRVTSDFQQFPKDAIKDDDGNELFQPRRMVKCSGGEYKGIVYLDYSQIELRLQAFYTILVGHPDRNLCRAYMPYDCVDNDGHVFDYTSYKDICNWRGQWFYREATEEHWIATDVHGATTKEAFDIDENHPDYKKLRYIGKRVNFAKNYGAKRQCIRLMFPHMTEEQITKIDGAYYRAFPGVKMYHDYCYKRAAMFATTENLFGINYYGVPGHNLINMLVQGSAAYFLKWKIRQIYEYSKMNGIKSRFQMNIHDELSFEVNEADDPKIFFDIQEIMESWKDTYVPIVADMEVTTKTWADKIEVTTLEELKEALAS